jgi:hypothetical protein
MFITAGPSTKLCAGRRKMVQDVSWDTTSRGRCGLEREKRGEEKWSAQGRVNMIQTRTLVLRVLKTLVVKKGP